MKYGSQPHPAYANAAEARRAEREAERRDLFARAALTGLLAKQDRYPATVAEEAYRIADAMMAARDTK